MQHASFQRRCFLPRIQNDGLWKLHSFKINSFYVKLPFQVISISEDWNLIDFKHYRARKRRTLYSMYVHGFKHLYLSWIVWSSNVFKGVSVLKYDPISDTFEQILLCSKFVNQYGLHLCPERSSWIIQFWYE